MYWIECVHKTTKSVQKMQYKEMEDTKNESNLNRLQIFREYKSVDIWEMKIIVYWVCFIRLILIIITVNFDCKSVYNTHHNWLSARYRTSGTLQVLVRYS
jgi:hypothetical protein